MTDRDARRELLLTRIALDRAELRRDLSCLRDAARLPPLLHSLVGVVLAPRPRLAGGNWLAMALALWRRYPVLTSLLGLTTPLLRRRRGLRRALMLLAFIGGLAAAWRRPIKSAR